ncbi:nipped-B-like protein B [Lampris incognitus]|uniref:nipped-B-like protein B n=1 Tax=Lampris incognitus TaxID=2546036 RepID=UPI0024B530EC|nr:nipped-B-like protein B [Lampris incognitus]
MNGDMPHVPITTLAGIASLTDLLNQLPLPSPLPATTTKSLLYNERIAEEVSCLLACQDENLGSQLAHSLNQVSTENIELKDNLGNDDPEGEMPVLLQMVLSRSPNIFREKSMSEKYMVRGIMQQARMPQYKLSQNPGSPAPNYQPSTVSHSPSSHFVPPQSGSGAQFLPHQNSPITSPYTPQSPENYMQYHPPSYPQHQQIQQGEYLASASPPVPGVRNTHDTKVSGHLSNNSAKNNARLGSDNDYISMVNKLENEDSDPSVRNASFPITSPQSACSPAGSEETTKRSPPHILQSPCPDAPPDLLLVSTDLKKKRKRLNKEETEQMDSDALDDVVYSPSKDSTKLTLKLSQVKSSEIDQSGLIPPRTDNGSDQDNDLICIKQLSRTVLDPSHKLSAGEQTGWQQDSVLQNTQQAGIINGVMHDDAELNALTEFERIERDSTNERERCSKVQDKDKPLKKRKQDSYPQEPGVGGTAWSNGGPNVEGGNVGIKLTPSEDSSESNDASRPTLMVSIDLRQAGRGKGQPDVALEIKHLCEDHLRLKSKTDKIIQSRSSMIKPHTDSSRKLCPDGRRETLKHKHEHRRDSKHQHNEKADSSKGHRDGRGSDVPDQKPEGRCDSGHREEKHQDNDPSRICHIKTPKSSSKPERDSKYKQDKERDKEKGKDRDKDRNKERKHRTESGEKRNRHSTDQRSKLDIPRIMQERRGLADPSGRHRTDCSSFHSSRGKNEKRSRDVSQNRQDGNNQQSFESKHSDFPLYLLGGKSGSLKNFVIPKLKRDGRDKGQQPGKEVTQGLSQPQVKLERISLKDNLGKAAKPVLMLQKLTVDDVKKIIGENKDKNAHSSKSRNWSSSDKSGRESSIPLCESVKMNKRKRSVVSDGTKYAEVDSNGGEGNSVTESSQKRHKKDRDKAREQEERRSSREHCQSGEFHEGRQGSRNHYHERSPEDSDNGSPSPSMRDIVKKIKKKEKQKKRKEHESKSTPEELKESSSFKRFSASLDKILEKLEDADFTAIDDDEIPQELLLGKHQLSELGSKSAKIKVMGIAYRLPSDKLVKLLNILEKNIKDGAKLATLMNPDNGAMDEERLWRDLIMERVTKSADACLTSLNIMTSRSMPKAVYIEDVIERVVHYTKFHLQNTLYPQYDPVYRVDPHGGGMVSSKTKRAKCSLHKPKEIVMLYNKVCDIVSNISELLEIQLLTDTTILQVSSLGITPFFVENVSELQLRAIKLVAAVFSRYEKHRQLILEEIFASLDRLPTSKRNLRNFRLNSVDADGEPLHIQMVTALVLQLIQCVVRLPADKDTENENDKKVDRGVYITNSYETAMRTAQNFLSVFLKKCGSKQGKEDYRPLFENFIQDLLSTVNKPEWPAAELLLSLLGRLLVHQFSNKQTEMALRVVSLDYLGTVTSRLRKDAVTSKMDQKSIDRILSENPGNDETQQLQKALLAYLDKNMEIDPSLGFARKFYIAQWFRDTAAETEKNIRSQTQKDKDLSVDWHHADDVETTGEIMRRDEARKKFLHKVIKTAPLQLNGLRVNSDTVDYEDSCLIVRYLASMRPFAQCFDIYLTQILRVLGESAIAVRTKAIKCLSEVVAVDPSILARLDMQRGVHGRLMDSSSSVREAAVDLLGRFVLSRPQLTEQYYDMLIERILDTGISVRKRVIKILRDICLEQPGFHKITEICVKMIRRVSDEEGIKKLVNETFQKLWFTPTPSHDKDAMTRKILNITDVVSACKDTGYDWFEQLLQNLLKSEDDASYKPAKKACIQLVDTLVADILTDEDSLTDCETKGINSDRIVACITTLYLFSKISAHFMVKHAMTVQPYLTRKCSNDFMVICNVAKILELVVPLMEHPSETFLTSLEEDLMKLIIKSGMAVVQHCVSCLGAVVNKVTQNYKLVWSCFNCYCGALTNLKIQIQENPSSSALTANKPALLRSLFTVGALCRYFDFDQEKFKGNIKVVVKDKVLELLLFFTTHEDEEVQIKALIGLGFQFIMHPALMFVQDIKTLYNGILSESKSLVTLKVQVLKNLQNYLQEEDSRMQEADREWKNTSKQEDLKEMGDITSGMSSSIIQLYLKQVLEAFFHAQSTVRHFALSVVTLTLKQGLIHPVQCVPYLIAMGTDPEPTMRNVADQQLLEIDKKYTGFIHMKAVAGLKMSYQVQQAITGSKDTVIRGYRQDETTLALCSHLFTMVRGNRQHRRAFLISLLNLFDDSSKTELDMLLFIADNLACFPYQCHEEPLFIMHHVDIRLSVSGTNLLQSFKESLHKEPVRQKKKKSPRERKHCSEDEQESSTSDSSDGDDEVVQRRKKPSQHMESDSDSDMEDVEKVMERLPDNPIPLRDFANASQGILLLVVLKQHLKSLYGFSESKIQKYSPTESAKVYDKALNRKSNVHFNPQQTLDFLNSDLAGSNLSREIKRSIVKQYLNFKLLIEHLDPDEEDEEVEEGSNARNKAISSLLGDPNSQNHNPHPQTAPEKSDEEESDDEEKPGRLSKKVGESAEALGHMDEKVEAMDIIAICCPKYKDRPQIAKVIKKTSTGYRVHWMAGSYSGSWAETKKRDGRKLVPWVDTIKESDIICKKISLTSGHKLTNRVVATLRALYASKEGTTH